MSTTYKIPAGKLDQLAKQVAELNKRAARLGLAPITFTAGPVRYESIPAGRYIDEDGNPAEELGGRLRAVVDVELVGEVPRLAGWTLLATLSHMDGGNLITRIAARETDDLSAWATAPAACSHCGVNRRRNDTWILQNEQGETRQIGSTCLEDFTRSTDAARAAELWRLWAELRGALGEGDEGEDWGFGGAAHEVPTLEYIAAAFRSIRDRGWHPSSDRELSTRSDVDIITGRPPIKQRDREAWEASQPTDADRARAAEAIAWVQSTAGGPWNEYLHNLRIAVDAPVVAHRTRGVLASAPVAFDRELERTRKRAEADAALPTPAEHFGTVGERFTSPVTVERAIGYQNDWGTGKILIMRTPGGHRLKYFASGEAARLDDYEGAWVLLATVKKHDREAAKYGGHPVSLVTRGRLVRPDDPSLAPKKRARKPKAAPAADAAHP